MNKREKVNKAQYVLIAGEKRENGCKMNIATTFYKLQGKNRK
jgi:hypothetical protein